nr:hypothetical protein [Haloferax profundi]
MEDVESTLTVLEDERRIKFVILLFEIFWRFISRCGECCPKLLEFVLFSNNEVDVFCRVLELLECKSASPNEVNRDRLVD